MIEICAVGDISPGDHYFCAGCGVGSTFSANPPDFLFEKIEPVIRGADITFGNLEGVLSNYGLNTRDIESVVFRGNPKMAGSLRDAGFTILNIANNHILQHGRKAFEDTVSVLKQNEIIPLGIASSNQFSCSPVYLEVKGMRIGFLGYSLVPENYYSGERLYARGPIEAIVKDISKLSQQVDFVIVSLHQGLEGINRPSPYGAILSRQIIDAGARVVLGHHSHVFQKVEEYNHGLICNSLGNFIFDLLWYPPLNWSSIVKIKIWPDNTLSYSFRPFRINRNFQPVPFSGPELKEKFNVIKGLKTPDLYCNFEKESYNYYSELAKIEKYLARRRVLFFLSHLTKGKLHLKIKFLINKVTKRLLY